MSDISDCYAVWIYSSVHYHGYIWLAFLKADSQCMAICIDLCTYLSHPLSFMMCPHISVAHPRPQCDFTKLDVKWWGWLRHTEYT